MIIKNIELENIGRHPNIKFDSEAPVVGLIGPNGSGKSTVMRMVEYLVTGEIEGAAAGYVRNYEGNGKARMTFQKDGKEGTIFRQFGKTTRRQLDWDGEKITGAKAVESKLTEIFGVDKKAIANAVFINQGMLEQILFDSYKEKRKAFIQLVNLAFCEARARQIDGHIKRIEATIEDLTPMLDARNAELNEAEINLNRLESELSETPDYSEAIQCLEQLSKIFDHLEQLSTQKGQAENQIDQIQSRIDSTLTAWGYSSTNLLVEDRDAMESEIEGKHRQLEGLKKTAADIETLEDCRSQKESLDEAIRSARYQLHEYNPGDRSTDEMDAELDSIDKKINDLRKKEELSQEMAEDRKAFQDTMGELNEISKSQPSQEALDAKREELENASNHLAELERYWEVQEEIRSILSDEAKQSETVSCPKCGLTVLAARSLSEADRNTLYQNLEKARKDKKEIQSEVESLDREITEHYKRRSDCQSRLQSLNNRIGDLQKKINRCPSDESIEDALKRRQSLADRLKQVRALSEQIRSNAQKQEHLKSIASRCDQGASELAELTGWSLSSIQSLDYGPHPGLETLKERVSIDAIHNLQNEIAYREDWLKKCRKTAQELLQFQTQRSSQYERIDEIKQKQDRLNSQLNTVEDWLKRIKSDVVEGKEINDVTNEEIDTALHRLKESQSSYRELKGRRDEAKSTYDNARKRLKEVEDRVEKDRHKQNLLEDLRSLKELMTEEGLPLDFVRYQFEHLARLTQEALVTLNADFAIEIDRSADLAFQFIRLDEDNPVSLPMDKLSGGQRVMLCIAFLIAVQKQLVSNVGLLVLDEPSIHCDDDAVNNLVALFRDLQRQLEHTETQIWVCDHNPQIQLAMQRVLELT